jgi:hypothetical protein
MAVRPPIRRFAVVAVTIDRQHLSNGRVELRRHEKSCGPGRLLETMRPSRPIRESRSGQLAYASSAALSMPSSGLDDRAIHDLCAIVAYFNFVNRIADGLGVELEDRPAP